ncbi:O-antigen ligase family protein [Phyllobacterium endophyticum]|uniref:Polymerase n=1 Tax=Phyllobacterium endophyticum TaxID=1149773 RepID=A0A2P7B1M9_9HYPH|nr:O-antigen ligase family protein [Phyllobacterium endophyticum]MBB3237943.1 O-antigen ligase [Phyllobacterium endophyticum]PSH60368.1 polymerase [Phyllobacterium endophyticum]TYR42545.1 O-antigen ligase family protein [Phyllobacterium endophyticum]
MLSDQLTKAIMLPTKGHFIGIDRNNRLFTFVFALFPGLLASGTSVTLVCAFMWALVSLAARRFAFKMNRTDKIVAFCLTFYVLVTILSVLLHPNPAKGGAFILKMIPFLAIWAVLPRLRVSLPGRLLPFLIIGAGVGMMGSLLFSIVQTTVLSARAEGGAGNAAVFGLFAVLFGSISLLNAHSESKIERFIAIAGFACGLVCAFLSATRSAWLVMPVHFVILYWYLRGQTLPTVTNAAKVVGTVLIVGIVAVGAIKVTERFHALENDIVQLDHQPDDISSLNARLMLWSAARQALLASPFIGHGPQNRMTLVNEILDLPPEKQMTFTHVHNGFLNAAVDAGLLGVLAVLALLAAPVVAARRKEPGPGRDLATAISLLLVSSYVITGMFGIMFGHDATDAVFIYLTIMICWISGTSPYLSIPEVAARAEADKQALIA